MLKPRTLFLSKLILFSCAVHCLILVLFFFIIQQNNHIKLTISGTATELDWANVVMMPLVKHMPTVAPKTVQQPQKSVQTAQPKPAANKKPATQLVQQQQPKKTAPQKQQPVVVAKKEPVKQPEPKKVEVAKQQPPAQNVVPAQVPSEPEKIYIGRNDKELLLVQQELYTQLANTWKPPVGMPADIACSIKAIIAKNGMVADVIMDNPSHVLVFDVAARTAILQTEFPESVWGKEIIITFNQ